MLITTVIDVVLAIATAFAPDLITYAVLRTLIGVALAGQFNCAYIIGKYVELYIILYYSLLPQGVLERPSP